LFDFFALAWDSLLLGVFGCVGFSPACEICSLVLIGAGESWFFALPASLVFARFGLDL
jgi:hypothetical protein